MYIFIYNFVYCIKLFLIFRLGYAHTLNKNPIYNWGCVTNGLLSAANFEMETMPPLECPKPCEQYDDCISCLESPGSDGGWHQCVWSVTRAIVSAFSYNFCY